VNELESHPAQRRGAIRSDAIQIRFDFDWMQIWYRFYPISISFNSILIQFDSIRFAPTVTFLLLLLLLFNLFHISNKYRTNMAPGILSSVVVSLIPL
jgi:hypothetical protein